ncbi:hypothetical protein FQZ97_986760 [compost metagenome]
MALGCHGLHGVFGKPPPRQALGGCTGLAEHGEIEVATQRGLLERVGHATAELHRDAACHQRLDHRTHPAVRQAIAHPHAHHAGMGLAQFAQFGKQVLGRQVHLGGAPQEGHPKRRGPHAARHSLEELHARRAFDAGDGLAQGAG